LQQNAKKYLLRFNYELSVQISTDRVTGQDATIGRVRLFVSTASFKSTDFAFDFFACYGP